MNGKIGEAGKCKKKERERKRMMEKEKIHRIAMGSKKNKRRFVLFLQAYLDVSNLAVLQHAN